MKEKIDFVIPWVDGSDPLWLEEKQAYMDTTTTSAIHHFRDMKLLKYWFRGVEKYANWVNKIHFITWGHIPEWLNVNNPKINIVNHRDYIPSNYLPTFSSHTIELNMHRIKGLTDKFVYFNDDMFLIGKTDLNFFFKNGLPCDRWRENISCLNGNSDTQFAHILTNVRQVIGKNFSKKEFMKIHRKKWLTLKNGKTIMNYIFFGKWPYMAEFDIIHIPAPFLKKTFIEVWEKENEWLDETCSHKFRDNKDINQYVMQLWQIFSGNFTPKNKKKFGTYFSINNENKELIETIRKQKDNVICINDSKIDGDYEEIMKPIKQAFQEILPEKSSFEK